MSGLHLTSLRLSQRAQDVLRAIADDCETSPGRVASEMMELALTGQGRPESERLTRKPSGAAAEDFMTAVLREQQGRVLASLRAAVAALRPSQETMERRS